MITYSYIMSHNVNVRAQPCIKFSIQREIGSNPHAIPFRRQNRIASIWNDLLLCNRNFIAAIQ